MAIVGDVLECQERRACFTLHGFNLSYQFEDLQSTAEMSHAQR